MESTSFHNIIIDEISKKFKIDKRIANLTTRSPFSFLVERIRDNEDSRPIRFKYLGVFAIIKGREKSKLQQENHKNDN